MTNTYNHAKKELEILAKTVPDALVNEFSSEILTLCEAFGNSGQSGGSAPYTAAAIAETVKKLCLQKSIAPLTGEDDEWGTVADNLNQNNREYSVFRRGKNNRAYYLNAIVWQGEDSWDTFTGTVEGITSRQVIKQFPFTPKRFVINVFRVPYDKDQHKVSDAVSCASGDFVYFIKDKTQLEEVFKYYDQYFEEKELN